MFCRLQNFEVVFVCGQAIDVLARGETPVTLTQYILVFGAVNLILAQCPNFHSIRFVNQTATFCTISFSIIAVALSLYSGEPLQVLFQSIEVMTPNPPVLNQCFLRDFSRALRAHIKLFLILAPSHSQSLPWLSLCAEVNPCTTPLFSLFAFFLLFFLQRLIFAWRQFARPDQNCPRLMQMQVRSLSYVSLHLA